MIANQWADRPASAETMRKGSNDLNPRIHSRDLGGRPTPFPPFSSLDKSSGEEGRGAPDFSGHPTEVGCCDNESHLYHYIKMW